MKEFLEKLIEKIKVTSLEIIVTGTKEKPYFEIKYKEVGKEDYKIGYSSYDLNNVLNWKEECFEIVNQLAEEYNNGWIAVTERLPKCENGCETKALMFQMKETGSIKCGYYGEGGFYRDKYFRTYTNNTDGYDARDVIAWQPLPAPYKKGE